MEKNDRVTGRTADEAEVAPASFGDAATARRAGSAPSPAARSLEQDGSDPDPKKTAGSDLLPPSRVNGLDSGPGSGGGREPLGSRPRRQQLSGA
jgi:hypothetical protein